MTIGIVKEYVTEFHNYDVEQTIYASSFASVAHGCIVRALTHSTSGFPKSYCKECELSFEIGCAGTLTGKMFRGLK